MTTPVPAGEISVSELMGEMKIIVQEEVGFNDLFAAQIAAAITNGLRRRLGGREIYILAPDKTERDAAIRAKFNGRNRIEVCAEFGVSKAQLYRIVGKK